MDTTHSINDTQSINAQLTATRVSAEARARAMQAAFVGEVVATAFGRIGTAISGLLHSWREWSERQQSLAYLERLDERLLADIGLSHATVEEALRHPGHRLAAGVVPPVETLIAETATVATAANQDRGQDHGRVRVAQRDAA